MFWFQIVKSEPGTRTRSNRIFGDASNQHEEIPKTGRGIRDCENERFVEE